MCPPPKPPNLPGQPPARGTPIPTLQHGPQASRGPALHQRKTRRRDRPRVLGGGGARGCCAHPLGHPARHSQVPMPKQLTLRPPPRAGGRCRPLTQRRRARKTVTTALSPGQALTRVSLRYLANQHQQSQCCLTIRLALKYSPKMQQARQSLKTAASELVW